MKYIFLSFSIFSILVVTGCSRDNKVTTQDKLQQCSCQVLESFVKSAGLYQEISSNVDKSEITEGADIITSVSFDSVGKRFQLVIPTSSFKDKTYNYREITYDGSKDDFQQSMFLTQWCDIWYLYHSPETCLIPKNNIIQYRKEIDSLTLKFDGNRIKSRDIPQKEIKEVQQPVIEKIPSNTPPKEEIGERKECKDTIIMPSYYGWTNFTYVKLNSIEVPALSDGRHSFCYVIGDTLEIKNTSGELNSIIFK